MIDSREGEVIVDCVDQMKRMEKDNTAFMMYGQDINPEREREPLESFHGIQEDLVATNDKKVKVSTRI